MIASVLFRITMVPFFWTPCSTQHTVCCPHSRWYFCLLAKDALRVISEIISQCENSRRHAISVAPISEINQFEFRSKSDKLSKKERSYHMSFARNKTCCGSNNYSPMLDYKYFVCLSYLFCKLFQNNTVVFCMPCILIQYVTVKPVYNGW